MKYANIAFAAALVVAAAPALAQDAAHGQTVFRKCGACHKVGDNARNSTGPVLTNVVGRQAGTFEGYRYGSSMQAAGAAGLVWTEALIAQYISDPTGFLRSFLGDSSARAKMTFRLRKESDRLDVAAYLASLAAVDSSDAGQFCIENASPNDHLFVVETREGDRALDRLAPGEQLCSSQSASLDGVVSVFESAEVMEGCSRIVPVGATETLTVFADFDRCGWGSHQG